MYSMETYLAYPPCKEDGPEQDIWIKPSEYLRDKAQLVALSKLRSKVEFWM